MTDYTDFEVGDKVWWSVADRPAVVTHVFQATFNVRVDDPEWGDGLYCVYEPELTKIEEES